MKQKNKQTKVLDKTIYLTKIEKTKHKCCTTIEGLEAFGFSLLLFFHLGQNLKDLSSTLRKQLATGVCIKDNIIEVQGNCLYELAMFANKTLKIKASSIFVVEGKKKICIKEYPFER